MFKRIVDEDIELELIWDGLADKLFIAVDDCRDYLREWLGWVDSTRTVNDTREFCRLSLNGYAEGHMVRCAIRYQGEVAGSVSLERISRDNDSAEIGYWLTERFQGRGIVTRCVQNLTELAFDDLDLHRLYIRVAEGNRKSAAIPERLGWVYEGTMREQISLYRQWHDARLYSRLSHEAP